MKKNKHLKFQQQGLFGTELNCADVENLPLIFNAKPEEIEVLAPGTVYKPLLLSPDERQLNIQGVGPGALDRNEEKFVRDLIRYLYPTGDYPKSEKTPLLWQGKHVWLKRNIDKEPGSFRLRVDDSDWFYPDFIVWIMDYKTRTQTFGFVDPKGLALGTSEGWGNYKIVSTLYMPHVIEQKMEGLPLVWEGEQWTFRVRGVLISTTSLLGLTQQAKFSIFDESGKDIPPDEADFNRARIVFPTMNTSYIETVLKLLTEDNELDGLLNHVARIYHTPKTFTPNCEADYDLALRHVEAKEGEANFIAEIVKDYLKPNAKGKFGANAQRQTRLKLMDYAKTGFFGLGEEKVPFFRDHPSPCEELWQRFSAMGSDKLSVLKA